MACSPGLVTRADCFFFLRGCVLIKRCVGGLPVGVLTWFSWLGTGVGGWCVCLLVRVGGWLAGWWEGGWVARLLHTRV